MLCITKQNMFSEKISSLKALDNAAQKLISSFPGQRVFAFYGKMGSGKTTFIQAVCRAIGTGDNVTSPTFAIINQYNTEEGEPIYHFDFYRINIFPSPPNHVFFTFGDKQMTVFVEIADVACKQKPVSQRFGCFLRALPIAFHHTPPFDGDLPPLPAGHFLTALVNNTDLHSLHGLAD